MKRLAHNSKPPHGSPRPVPLRPALDPILTSRPLSHRFPTSRAPFNLNTARVHRPSDLPLKVFSNARPHPLFCSTHSPRARLRKSTSVIRPERRTIRSGSSAAPTHVVATWLTLSQELASERLCERVRLTLAGRDQLAQIPVYQRSPGV
jgi:hypothetical protein